jgi:hypothetical protein
VLCSAEDRAPRKARPTPLAWLGIAFRWLAERLTQAWSVLFLPGGTVQHAPLTFSSPIDGQG